jgi:hypothetical protein
VSSAVTTATITAVTSSRASLSTAATVGIAVLILLVILLAEKEVLASSVQPEILAATRYLNVVIVPLLLAGGLIAAFRLGMAIGVIH